MKDGFQMVTILTGHWAKHRSMALLELKKILSENCHLERLPLAMGSSDPQMLVEQIVADYEQPLRRLSNCYTRESSIAEDLFQEIVLALCCALPQYRGECTVRTWVYRIAHNVAISFAAKGRRDRQRSRPLSEADTVADAGRETGDRALLLAAIRKLPMADQQLVMLYLEGLSALEIEQVTGVSSANVATRLSRIRKSMSIEVSQSL
jgi:RNA polymerase sigma factor (sigma-70 family)